MNVFMKHGGLNKIISIPDDVVADMEVVVRNMCADYDMDSVVMNATDRLETFLHDMREAEAEEDARQAIIDCLKREDEDKLKEAHAKEYHGTDDEMPDAYESWLENLTSTELKAILI